MKIYNLWMDEHHLEMRLCILDSDNYMDRIVFRILLEDGSEKGERAKSEIIEIFRKLNGGEL